MENKIGTETNVIEENTNGEIEPKELDAIAGGLIGLFHGKEGFIPCV